MFFDKLTRKIEIEGTLRCVTALRIGAGKDHGDIAATDLPVLKDAMGRPLLPGASLKGVVRSSIEAVLRAIPTDADQVTQWACDPFLDRCVKDPDAKERLEMESMQPPERAEHQRGRLKGLCRVCQTFGAQGLASHVLFRDARAQGKVHLERRDGVAIDRDLGRVSGGRKYDFEVISEGSRFDFGLTIDSAKDWQEGVVVLGLELLHEGFARVGGATSRGLGLVAFEGLKARVLDVKALRGGGGGGLPFQVIEWPEFRRTSLAAWEQYVKNGGKPSGEG